MLTADATGDEVQQTVIDSHDTQTDTHNGTVINRNKVIAIIAAAAIVTCGAATGITSLLKKARTRDGG